MLEWLDLLDGNLLSGSSVNGTAYNTVCALANDLADLVLASDAESDSRFEFFVARRSRLERSSGDVGFSDGRCSCRSRIVVLRWLRRQLFLHVVRFRSGTSRFGDGSHVEAHVVHVVCRCCWCSGCERRQRFDRGRRLRFGWWSMRGCCDRDGRDTGRRSSRCIDGTIVERSRRRTVLRWDGRHGARSRR